MVGGNIGAATTSGSSTSTFRCIESTRAWRMWSESLRAPWPWVQPLRRRDRVQRWRGAGTSRGTTMIAPS